MVLLQVFAESIRIKITFRTQIPELFDIVYRKLFVGHYLKVQHVRILIYNGYLPQLSAVDGDYLSDKSNEEKRHG